MSWRSQYFRIGFARWYLQLQQFEITYVPQKGVKGQVLADFLADHPMPAEWELSDDLPDEDVLVIEVTPPWKMYFDGASHKEGAGTGVVFVTSEGELARQGKISLEEDSAATNVITIESEHVNGNKDSCNTTHGDNITSNEDTLFEKEDSSDTDDCMSTITFTDEDLLLGSKPHNRPLFVAGYVREQKVNRILIDGGSAVNILPLQILKELEILIDELSNSRLMIQGFNQGGQRAVGIIRMQLTMDDMVSSALFHVIDAKTSYNMLLGRPWLHENAVVPSTWHQCFKYCRNCIVKKMLTRERKYCPPKSQSHAIIKK
ncbi:UNVERIFIED_CONTAM: hypothetical protein Sradi_6735100 [Sesamum radiatum]|uniref:Uncharacterized protein n=1 Tax=Sesamum radiatum TaxID=300843 RepID=A0AAW2JT61_SESRA